MKLSSSILLVACAAFVGCHNHDDDSAGSAGGGPGGGASGGGIGGEIDLGPATAAAGLDGLDLGPDGRDIVDLTDPALDPLLTDVFDRYAAYTTPSGDRVHVLAEGGVDDSVIRRTVDVLGLQLADVQGATAGADKGDIADVMASENAAIALFADRASFEPPTAAVQAFGADFENRFIPLAADEVVVEGTEPYHRQSPARDRTFSASAALIHRLGLRTERPDWVASLRDRRADAELAGTFTGTDTGRYLDLDEVYLGALAESHAGVWGHDPDGDGGAIGGTYAFGSRDAMASGDPAALALYGDMFAARHDFPARVAPEFTGTFDMLFRTSTPYSNRSRYLRDVTLTGSLFAELFGTSGDDVLTGNDGNNNIRGRSGDDVIDGGPGNDTAIFLADQAEFTVTFHPDGSVTVQHNAGTLGTNTVRNCEQILFRDGRIDL